MNVFHIPANESDRCFRIVSPNLERTSPNPTRAAVGQRVVKEPQIATTDDSNSTLTGIGDSNEY